MPEDRAGPARWVRRRPFSAGPALAAAAAVALLAAACSGSHQEGSTRQADAASHTSPSASVPPPSTSRRAVIATALSAPRPRSVAAVLPRSIASAYLARPFAMVPAGSKLTVDWSQLRQSGYLAQVPATVTGSRPGSWMLLLIWQHGQWDVYGTRKAAS